jgi:hypothetical protein
MTTPKPTPPEKQNSPAAPDSEETRPNRADATAFFNRVRRELNSEEAPLHPTEAAQIVIMEEEGK